ncbi:MAG: hypothetical protein JWQ20_3764, partial [Conexibacter sp.]|nr:hypothetical protein [Conexibacter sp.]
VGPGDDDEAHDDARRLGDLTAIGPLNALKLGPGRLQEVPEPRTAMGLDRRAAAGPGQLAILVVDVTVVVEIADLLGA